MRHALHPPWSAPVLTLALGIGMALAGCKERPAAAVAEPPSDDFAALPPPGVFDPTQLDPQHPPCVDFDRHVNDKWRAATAIPEGHTRWGVMEALAERSRRMQRQLAARAAANPDAAEAAAAERIVGDFWASGMDRARIDSQGIHPLQPQLDAIAVLTDKDSIAAYLYERTAAGANPLFRFGPAPGSPVIPQVVADGLGLAEPGDYFDTEQRAVRDAYLAHIARLLELSGIDSELAARQARDVLAFETRLAKTLPPTRAGHPIAAPPDALIEPAAADKLTPHFSWTRLFQAQRLASQPFSLPTPQYHREISAMLQQLPSNQWKSYLRWRTLEASADFLGEPFLAEQRAFHSQFMTADWRLPARWEQVLDAMRLHAVDAMDTLYAQAALPAPSRQTLHTMLAHLTQAAHAGPAQETGRTDNARAMSKQTDGPFLIALADTSPDWSGLVGSREDYLANAQALQAHRHRQQLVRLGQPSSFERPHARAQDVDIHYDDAHDRIVLGAALLQPPLFDPGADDALNYGAIGSLLGRALARAHDLPRIPPDADPPSPGEAARALRRAITLQEAHPTDLRGLQIAHRAMHQAVADQPDPQVAGMNREQRFFAGYALTWRHRTRHDPAPATSAPSDAIQASALNASLSRLPAFATAFDCRPGDPMVAAGTEPAPTH